MLSSIRLPAHILDAHISPRAREVLMLMASQTSPESPTTWICQATIGARLRCSVATVARAIQKLIEAKLIAETGRLQEGRYKIYHVRWNGDENMKAVSKKIRGPVLKVGATKPKKSVPVPVPKRIQVPVEGIQLILPPVVEVEAPAMPLPGPSTLTPQTIHKDSRIAYYADLARKQHEESLRLYKTALLSMR